MRAADELVNDLIVHDSCHVFEILLLRKNYECLCLSIFPTQKIMKVFTFFWKTLYNLFFLILAMRLQYFSKAVIS